MTAVVTRERATFVSAPVPEDLAPRHERMVRAFRLAAGFGMTRRELRRECGPRWRDVLRDLRRAGFLFEEHRSRFNQETFRWVLVGEPEPSGHVDVDDVDF